MASRAGAGSASRSERSFSPATKAGVGQPASISWTSSASVPCQAVIRTASPASQGMATSARRDAVAAMRSQRDR